MSTCTEPITDAKKAVQEPKSTSNVSVEGEYSNIIEQRTTKNTPAVTIVAACIKADTGVGPSIASGSQVCKPTCADLPTAPIKRKKETKVKKSNLKPNKQYVTSQKKGTKENITKKSKVRKTL